MKRWLVVMAMLVVGCKAELGAANGGGDDDSINDDDGGDDSSQVDAAESGDDGSIDAAEDLDAGLTTVDGPRCAQKVVYLEFGGVQLTQAPTSDAHANKASWLGEDGSGITTAQVPPFLQNDPNRLAKIGQVTDRVRTGLAEFPLQVVTTRPASGEYILVAFGGTNTNVGTPYTYARNVQDCNDAVPNDVMWVGDGIPFDKVDDYTMGGIGFGIGLAGTLNPNTDNCMCGWANGCRQPETTQCTFSASIATDGTCNVGPQDQKAALEAAFCTP